MKTLVCVLDLSSIDASRSFVRRLVLNKITNNVRRLYVTSTQIIGHISSDLAIGESGRGDDTARVN